MASLKDKVVLITGSGDEAGIGASAALYMIQYQPRLVLTDRDEQGLRRVGQLCIEAGLTEDRMLQVVADVTRDSDLERLVESTIQTFKQIDVLVNNAAIISFHNILDTSMADFDQVLNTNLRAPFYLTKLCIPHLVKTKGNIVNISSLNGTSASLNHVAYSISKAGLDHLTKIVAMEVAQHGVRVNSVNPALIVTGLQKHAGFTDDEYAKYLDRANERHPLGRLGSTRDVAKAIVFLASDESSFTTGHHLFVDGGRRIKPC